MSAGYRYTASRAVDYGPWSVPTHGSRGGATATARIVRAALLPWTGSTTPVGHVVVELDGTLSCSIPTPPTQSPWGSARGSGRRGPSVQRPWPSLLAFDGVHNREQLIRVASRPAHLQRGWTDAPTAGYARTSGSTTSSTSSIVVA